MYFIGSISSYVIYGTWRETTCNKIIRKSNVLPKLNLLNLFDEFVMNWYSFEILICVIDVQETTVCTFFIIGFCVFFSFFRKMIILSVCCVCLFLFLIIVKCRFVVFCFVLCSLLINNEESNILYKYHVTKQGSNWCMVNKNSHKTFFFIIKYHILQQELYLEF